MRFPSRAVPLFVVLALAACNSPQSDAKKADQAAEKANDKIMQAEREAQDKAVEVQDKADKDLARIQADAAKKYDDARMDVDKQLDKADAALVKARADARDSVTKKLEGLDKDAVELETKLEKKLTKPECDRVEQDIKARSAAARSSIRELDTASAQTLEAVKRKVDAKLANLERALSGAKKRI